MGRKPVARISAFMAAAVMLAGTAFVNAASVSAAPDTKKPDDRSRRVCRTIMPSGSRMTTRICRTQAEWDESQNKSQDGLLQHQMKQQSTYQQVPG